MGQELLFKTALVTGGAGFIGSHVVDNLIETGIDTRVLVSGFRSSKHPPIINRDAEIFNGDLREKTHLIDATKDIDIVFHLGGVFSHYCDIDPDMAIDVNIKGMWHLKQACAKNNVKRIIFASSSFVYGDPVLLFNNHDTITEEHATNPKDLLGITKLAGEKMLQAQYPYHIDYTILRLFNVYGPRQYPDQFYTSVISTWIMRAIKKQALEIHDDGTQSLDFIHVKDVADAFILATGEQAKNKIYNVGSGISISMSILAKMINTLTVNEVPSLYNPGHPMFIKYVQANISKIRSELGWYPRVHLENGLQETIQFFRGKL